MHDFRPYKFGPFVLPSSTHSAQSFVGRSEYQLVVKWMRACFQRADWRCSQAWLSLVHRADRQTDTEMSRTGCERWAQRGDCLCGMSGRWTNSGIAQIYCILIHTRRSARRASYSPALFLSSSNGPDVEILFVSSLFSFCFIIVLFLPAESLRDSSWRSPKISFYFPCL